MDAQGQAAMARLISVVHPGLSVAMRRKTCVAPAGPAALVVAAKLIVAAVRFAVRHRTLAAGIAAARPVKFAANPATTFGFALTRPRM
jgi:hypothetical protein